MMVEKKVRKIIHVDMDAFYASVEQRDNPTLKGKPIAVGYDGKRGVVATASYEARKHGIHSAMPTSIAKRLYPDLIFITPRFDVYRSVSNQIHTIFAEYTDLIEPVALDEAYLDVTENKLHIPSAWTIAQRIRDKIFVTTGLTASAGVSYNKFLAKSASDMRKPNGQYLITPDMSEAFIGKLPIAKFHGIGPATTEKMRQLGIETGAALRKWTGEDLQSRFGKLGLWYYQVAHGEDDRLVRADRERKSFSAETTFLDDISDKAQVEYSVRSLVNEVWDWMDKDKIFGRTVTLKVKWADFEQSTRSRTEKAPHASLEDFQNTALVLTDSIFPIDRKVRLLGVGVSNFNVAQTDGSHQLDLGI